MTFDNLKKLESLETNSVDEIRFVENVVYVPQSTCSLQKARILTTLFTSYYVLNCIIQYD